MEEFLKNIWPKISEYKGRIFGGSIGFIAGLIWCFRGFGQAFIFVFCIVLGLYVGKRYDGKDSFKDLLKKIIPPRK